MRKLLELYHYRELLRVLVSSELKLRYRRSVLGFFWTLLNPLLMMVVLSVVFSTVMRFNIRDYWVSLVAGLLPWTFFSQSVGTSLMSIVGKGALLKKVYIPKSIIPLSVVLAGLVNFLLSLVAMLVLMLAVGHPPALAVLFLPIPIAFMTLFAIGMALVFSCLNVYFRDFGHMTEVILQAWFYTSPVIYSLAMVPEPYRPYFMWNPLYFIIECFREPIFNGALPSAETVLTAGVVSLLAAIVGFLIFVRFERGFILRV